MSCAPNRLSDNPNNAAFRRDVDIFPLAFAFLLTLPPGPNPAMIPPYRLRLALRLALLAAALRANPDKVFCGLSLAPAFRLAFTDFTNDLARLNLARLLFLFACVCVGMVL